jgi:O-antigen ligase
MVLYGGIIYRHGDFLQRLAVVVACASPPMIGFVQAPISSALHQLAALLCWGIVIALAGFERQVRAAELPNQVFAPLSLWSLLLFGVVWSVVYRDLPIAIGLISAGFLLAAAISFLAGCAIGQAGEMEKWVELICVGWLILGLMLAVVSVIQVFFPGAADGDWIARTSDAGRAIGNMRQPNHTASFLCLACISAVWLGCSRAKFGFVMWPALVVLSFAIALTASRTGVLCLVLLFILAQFDRRIVDRAKHGLLVAVLALFVSMAVMAILARWGGFAVGSATRLSEGVGSPTRVAIWHDAFVLLLREPWTGVGWGEFNRAWALTEFKRQSAELPDHVHNLPLHVLTELGLPLGGLVIVFLVVTLIYAINPKEYLSNRLPFAYKCAVAQLVIVLIHSMLEYPLWYLYFLLPSALLLGICLAFRAVPESDSDPAKSDARTIRKRGGSFALAGLLMIVCSLTAWLDYQRVASLYLDEALPMPQEIGHGQRSVLFGPWADRIYADLMPESEAKLQAIERTAHVLVDPRLLMRWSETLASEGDVDRARYLARQVVTHWEPATTSWRSRCDVVALAHATPLWCDSPAQSYLPQDFR